VSLDVLYRSPEAGALLVELHDKHKMVTLAKDKSPTARQELAAIMADLLSVELNTAQSELVGDVLSNLIRQVEKDIRQAVALKLSSMDNVPLRLILELANDEIDVAAPILKDSQILDDNDLVYIVKTKTAEYWRSISQREKLSEKLVDVLADTGDFDTAFNVIKNEFVKVSLKASQVFAKHAGANDEFAQSFVARTDIPESVIETIYNHVGEQVKNYIVDHYDVDLANAFSEAQNYIHRELMAARGGDFTVTSQMIRDAERHMRDRKLNPSFIVDYLKRGQLASYKASMSVYCGVSVGVVEQMLHQKTAQGLAIMCRAVGVLKSDYVNMFLLSSRLRESGIINNGELNNALSYFDKVEVEFAKTILQSNRDA